MLLRVDVISLENLHRLRRRFLEIKLYWPHTQSGSAILRKSVLRNGQRCIERTMQFMSCFAIDEIYMFLDEVHKF
ncbi:hypothetical protein CWE14_04870 [Aliidiomarina soli]|uniref:Uncharacterized protein n=1 Tax=Aliidiomarina soli TaxID=1928574 RepID=A0A432WJE2_9GAMM|nr:hypothetical protein CWE14_04870 [Aliidiomarina soli]